MYQGVNIGKLETMVLWYLYALFFELSVSHEIQFSNLLLLALWNLMAKAVIIIIIVLIVCGYVIMIIIKNWIIW